MYIVYNDVREMDIRLQILKCKVFRFLLFVLVFLGKLVRFVFFSLRFERLKSLFCRPGHEPHELLWSHQGFAVRLLRLPVLLHGLGNPAPAERAVSLLVTGTPKAIFGRSPAKSTEGTSPFTLGPARLWVPVWVPKKPFFSNLTQTINVHEVCGT